MATEMNHRPNSHKFKQEQKEKEQAQVVEKKVDKVVSGKVKVKKKSELGRVKDELISKDANNVGSYILFDILVPSVKKAVADIVKNGVDMILYGQVKNGQYKSPSSKVSYRQYHDGGERYRSVEPRRVYDYDEIKLESRGEAEHVLMCMRDLLDTYEVVTVADYYDLVGVTGNWVDNDYGWTSLRTAEVVRVYDGYVIKLPRIVSVK